MATTERLDQIRYVSYANLIYLTRPFSGSQCRRITRVDNPLCKYLDLHPLCPCPHSIRLNPHLLLLSPHPLRLNPPPLLPLQVLMTTMLGATPNKIPHLGTSFLL